MKGFETTSTDKLSQEYIIKDYMTGDKILDEQLNAYIDSQIKTDEIPRSNTFNSEQIESLIKHHDHLEQNKILRETLSPHLGENEKQKRFLKIILTIVIGSVLGLQLIFLSVVIAIVFANMCFDLNFMKPIDKDFAMQVFDFLKYYITAVIAEFIAMLFFIVKFVFDKSIVDLTSELFKK